MSFNLPKFFRSISQKTVNAEQGAEKLVKNVAYAGEDVLAATGKAALNTGRTLVRSGEGVLGATGKAVLNTGRSVAHLADGGKKKPAAKKAAKKPAAKKQAAKKAAKKPVKK